MMTCRPEIALAHSEVYGLLARAFSYPDAALVAALGDGSFVADLSAALASCAHGAPDDSAPQGDAAAQAALAALQDTAAGEAPDLARQHLILFWPSYFRGQSPYETAYLDHQLFQKMQQMADIAGFYRAFGVETANIERPDFLATELEFLHYLTYREAWARAAGHADGADICWNAQRSFLRDHLGRWAPSFCMRLAEERDAPFYAALGALTADYITRHAASLDVELRPLGRALDEPMPREHEMCDSCPAGSHEREADHATVWR